MHWSDTAIVLSARRHGENSAVARLFSREHGVYGGVVRAAHSKTVRGVLQPGNVVNATWNARLSEQLGSFKTELMEPLAALIMLDAERLAVLSCACALIESALPERHPYAHLYEVFYAFLHVLKSDAHWQEDYVRLELELLAEAGFGLDLSQCAATGTTEDLIYVSPKSGRAVCREAGEPYKEKLLKLPSFLLPPPAGGGVGEGVEDGWVGVKLIRKPNRYGSHALIDNARELRGQMTDAEKHLWHHLRAHRFDGHSFRRQHPVTSHYIADFICLNKKLIIELDGGQHSEEQAYDIRRTTLLEAEGYRVIRFWNNEVFENMEGVLTGILAALETIPSKPYLTPSPLPFTPSLTLPPAGGGNNNEETLAGLRLTGYFLAHWLLEPHRRKLPAARTRLMEMMKE